MTCRSSLRSLRTSRQHAESTIHQIKCLVIIVVLNLENLVTDMLLQLRTIELQLPGHFHWCQRIVEAVAGIQQHARRGICGAGQGRDGGTHGGGGAARDWSCMAQRMLRPARQASEVTPLGLCAAMISSTSIGAMPASSASPSLTKTMSFHDSASLMALLSSWPMANSRRARCSGASPSVR